MYKPKTAARLIAMNTYTALEQAAASHLQVKAALMVSAYEDDPEYARDARIGLLLTVLHKECEEQGLNRVPILVSHELLRLAHRDVNGVGQETLQALREQLAGMLESINYGAKE